MLAGDGLDKISEKKNAWITPGEPGDSRVFLRPITALWQKPGVNCVG